MKTQRNILSLASLLIVACLVMPNIDVAEAAQISVAPTDVTTSTELGGFNRIGDHTVNGSGLAGGQHTNGPGGTMWLSNFTGSPGGTDPDPWIVFDFGSVYKVNSFHVWNYNESGGLSDRGVRDVTLYYTDSLTFGTDSGFQSTVAGVPLFTQANELPTYTGQSVSGFTPFAARYVLFEINNAVGVGNYGGDSYGLSEVQFDGIAFGSAPLQRFELGATVDNASSEFGGREAVKSINGSGTDIRGYHSNSFDTMWLSNAEVTPDITYDLGSIESIGTIEVWNYNEVAAANSDRGANEVEILVSNDNVTFTSVGTYFFSQAPETSDDDFSELFDLNTTGRYVKLDIKSNHGDGSFTGLSEVKFFEREAIKGVTATASSELTDGGFDRGASRATDGSGLNRETRAHGVGPESVFWLSDGVGFGGSAGDDSDPEITFDLGSIYGSLDSLRVWNYNEAGAFTLRGIQDTRILVSDDGISFTAVTDPTDLDQIFRFDQATGVGSGDFSQLIELNLVNAAVRYIKFDIITNWAGDNFDTNTIGGSLGFVGVSEVAFYGIPTPAALPAGLMMLGIVAARRKR